MDTSRYPTPGSLLHLLAALLLVEKDAGCHEDGTADDERLADESRAVAGLGEAAGLGGIRAGEVLRGVCRLLLCGLLCLLSCDLIGKILLRCDAVGLRRLVGGEPGQFIFTGPATPRDNERPMHSGAGRFAKLRMDTMTLFELGKSSGAVKLSSIISGEKFNGAFGSLDSASIAECVVRGGWPAAVGRDALAASAMAKRYIGIVAEEDLSRVDGSRRDPEKVKAVIESLARNESTLATLKTLVADLGGEVSRQTAASYISLLARVSFVRDIPAWNPAMRSPVHLRESKKHHLADPSLAAAALGATPETLLLDFKTLGLLFESLALHDLWVYARANGMSLYHYHDSRDLEVDAVIAAPGGTWIPVEVKLSSAQIEEASDNLVAVEERMVAAGNTPPVSKVAIIGFGSQAYVTARGVQVVPLDVLAP